MLVPFHIKKMAQVDVKIDVNENRLGTRQNSDGDDIHAAESLLPTTVYRLQYNS